MKIGIFTQGLKNSFACTQTNLRRTKFLFFILFCIISFAKAQTSSFSFTPVSVNEPDIISPGRGAEQWNDGSLAINYPAADVSQSSLDVYHRFTWNMLEGAEQGSYDWNVFDGFMRSAINKGQKLSFGIMTCYPDNSSQPGMVYYDNGNSAYPEYLHRLMQSENEPDWKTNGSYQTDGYGSWVPNWNSWYYLDRLRALHEALYDHIKSTSYTATAGPHKGETILYKNVIFSIDVRGYGSWGEWHSSGITDRMDNYPTGRRPTTATLKTIIDHHVNVFTDHALSMMVSAFDGERLFNTLTPKEVGAYILEKENNWGKLGWRRDSWGATDDYFDAYLKNNLNFFGLFGPFNSVIMERWKYAPITGEPLPGLAVNCIYGDILGQVKEYHATSVGNGNYGNYNLPGCIQENIREAMKASGYRILLEGGSVNNIISSGSNFTINLDWKNVGIAPTYDKWDVVFQLRDIDNQIAWSGVSKFSPGSKNLTTALLPSNVATTVEDNFSLPAGIPEGRYQLNLIVKDPTGYRAPLPLAIEGRNEDGSYTLKSVNVDSKTTVPSTPAPSPVPPTIPGDDCSVSTATIANTADCNDQAVNLVLSSATGTGPFDLVINGVTYQDIPVGGTITTINDETIWSTNPNPLSEVDKPVELGVKFSSSVAGYIKGIKFFSARNAAGNYSGHLWNQDGELLAEADFTNVTANGWQQVLFNEPVAISAGVVYTASYHTDAGIYAATEGGITDAVFNGESLTVLSNTTEGGNGVYVYGGSGFPTNTYNGSNYWVDVLFSKGPDKFDLTSVTDNTGCSVTKLFQSLTVTPGDCGQTQQRKSSTVTAAKAVSATAVTKDDLIFKDELSQNYPNPFRNETVINFSLAKSSKVNLSLFDMNGKLVKIILNGSREAGNHIIRFNAGSLADGIYFYKLQSGNYSAVKKMIIQ